MVRVLCLHGWGTNIEIFNYQIDSLRKHFSPEVEFVVLQGPSEVPIQRDPVILKRFKGKYYGWFNTKPRADNNGFELIGLQESLGYIRKHMEENKPYDGIMGFSQGAAVAMLLIALQNQDLFPGAFRFAIFVSPGLIPSLTAFDFVPRNLPVTFLMGTKDFFLPLGLTEMRAFLNPRIILHDSGHRFPKFTPKVLMEMRKVLLSENPPKL